MGVWVERFDDLHEQVKAKLSGMAVNLGGESNFFSESVLKIPDKVAWNLDGGRYLAEISENHLIDNDGQMYSYDVLPCEKLVGILDCLAV